MRVHAQLRRHQRKLARNEDHPIVASDETELATRLAAGPVASNLIIDPMQALVAQLDRASDFDSEGREFESLRARQTFDAP